MIVIAVFTIRFQAGLRAELSRSESDMRLRIAPRGGYCTTISSDIEEFTLDTAGAGYHPLSSKQKPQKIIVKNGETYLPCPSSCGSSCNIADYDYSPSASDKVL